MVKFFKRLACFGIVLMAQLPLSAHAEDKILGSTLVTTPQLQDTAGEARDRRLESLAIEVNAAARTVTNIVDQKCPDKTRVCGIEKTIQRGDTVMYYECSWTPPGGLYGCLITHESGKGSDGDPLVTYDLQLEVTPLNQIVFAHEYRRKSNTNRQLILLQDESHGKVIHEGLKSLATNLSSKEVVNVVEN